MRKNKREAEEQGLFGDPVSEPSAPGQPHRLMPVDIQQKEFRLGMRGYREAEVDEFLDEVTEELGRLHEEMARLREENERLRAGGVAPTTPFSGGAEIAEARRQSEEIVRRAREEAERIVRDAAAAAAGAASVSASASGSGGTAASSISPFLSREREFLQSMATLIQGHAEYVKAAAKAARKPGAAGGAAAPAAAAAGVAAMAAGTPEPEPAAAAEPVAPEEPGGGEEPGGPTPASVAVAEVAEAPMLDPTPVEDEAPTAEAWAAESSDEAAAAAEDEPTADDEPAPAEGADPSGLGAVDLSPWTRMQTGPTPAPSPSPEPRRDSTSEPTAAWQNPFASGRSDEESSSMDEPGAVSSSLEQEPAEGRREEERSLRELFWGED